VPKFTDVGFQVINTPDHVHKKLVEAVEQGVKEWEDLPSEGKIDVIYSPDGMDPKFVYIGNLASWTIEQLLVREKRILCVIIYSTAF
jgi:hypothetical protein